MLEGQQIDRYHLLQKIGSGGMGEVYLAEDKRIEQKVAVKLIRTEASGAPSPGAVRLFQHEAMAVAKLDHPNILPLYDYGEAIIEGRTLSYLVMPFRQEGTLDDWLHLHAQSGPLAPELVAHFISQAAEALQHAHKQHIIHQDIKPSNFLIRTRKERPDYPDLLLTDFGIAKFYIAASNMSQHVRGTPAYMPIEQWRGHPVPASDQYALAIMAYQMLTGQLPFRGRLEQLMRQHFSTQPEPPGALNPRLPSDVDSVILCALAKKAEERFASVTAFARALQQALAQPPRQNVRNFSRETAHHDANPVLVEETYTTVEITPSEAHTGISRVLTLPQGQQVNITIPSGVSDGQIIRFPSEPTPDRQTSGALILAIAIKPASGSTAGTNKHTSPSLFPLTGASKLLSKARGLLRVQTLILLGITLLIILASSGAFYAIGAYRASSNATATASTQIDLARTATAGTNARAAAAASAIATATAANPNPYPPGGGTLVLNDPLKDNSLGYNWDSYNPSDFQNGSDRFCQFTNGAYIDQEATPQSNFPCLAHNLDLSDFAIQVEMTLMAGDFGGIDCRDDSAHDRSYDFFIGQDGAYEFDLLGADSTGNHTKALTSGTLPPSVFHAGYNQSNLIAVVARGNTIDLYVNQHHITSVNVTTSSHGLLGMEADSVNQTKTTVAFRNIKIWKL